MRRALSSLALNDYSQWASFDRETFAAWANKALGPAVTEYLLEPMLHGFYFQEPEETSAALALVLLAFGFRRQRTLALRGGMGTLPEAMAARLDVVLDSPVVALESASNSVTVSTGTARMSADYVVLALPAPQARRLYSSSDETTRRLLATRYSSNINVAFMTDEQYRLPAELKPVYGLLVPRSERGIVAGIGIETNKSPVCAPRGELLNVMLSNTASGAMLVLDDGAIVDRVTEEAEGLFPGLAAHSESTRVYRWKDAEPYSPIGRAGDVLQYRSALGALERVVLAGDYMSMPFTEGAAESGRWAARRISGGCAGVD